jgi:hypothetical protein
MRGLVGIVHAGSLQDAHPRGGCTARFVPASRRASDTTTAMDRRLAYKNVRTGLIAGAIALIVFALSWVVGLVY